MTAILEPLRLENSSPLRVWLQTKDDRQPIDIVIEKDAIEECLGLPTSTTAERELIVLANLAVVTRIVVERYRQRRWIEVTSTGTRFLQILLTAAELRDGGFRAAPAT